MFFMDRFSDYLDRNTWARRAFYTFTFVFMYFLYKYTFVPYVGWSGVAIMLASFSAIMALFLGCMFAIGAGFYFLVIRKAKRYAEKLRGFGYDVWIDDHEIRSLSGAVVMFLLLSLMVYLLASLLYMGYQNHAAYDLPLSPGLWFMVVILVVIGLLWLAFAFTIVNEWRKSFRPLRLHYLKAKRGKEIPNLPRLIE